MTADIISHTYKQRCSQVVVEEVARQGSQVQHCVSYSSKHSVTATSVPPFCGIPSPVRACVLRNSTFLSTSHQRITGSEDLNPAEMLSITSVTMCLLWVVALSLRITNPNQERRGHCLHPYSRAKIACGSTMTTGIDSLSQRHPANAQ
jgi:hypothetical protein